MKAATVTENWMRCPIYADYKRRWDVRKPWTPHITIGLALAKGLESYYIQPQIKDDDWEAAMPDAQRVIEAEYQDNETYSRVEVEGHVRKALKVAVLGAKGSRGAQWIKQNERIVGVEFKLAAWGSGARDGNASRPDLITRTEDGLVVTDTKYTMHLDPQYTQKRLLEYDVSHQLWQYAWEVGLYFNEPVQWLRVHLVVGGPFAKSILFPIRVTNQRLMFWLRGAERAWQEMETGVVYPRFQSCIMKYGPCPYYAGCHDLHGDETKFPALYQERIHHAIN